MPALTTPALHANGTSRERLLENLEAAFDALDEAYRCLKRTAPNPRDYDAGTYDQAVTEHLRRLKLLDLIQGEIDQIVAALEV